MKKIILIFLNLILLFDFVKGQQNYDAKLLVKNDKIKDSLVLARIGKIEAVLKTTLPVLLLQSNSDTINTIQKLAIGDTLFKKYFIDKKLNEPTLSEIFGVYPLLPSNQNIGEIGECGVGNCFRVEMYNYAYNLTSVAYVNIKSKKVIGVDHYPDAQPDLPLHLSNLAVHIASVSAEVEEALGITPSNKDFIMASTQTALNYSKCERSRHLCVAPTFVQDQKALWCIVDLTELNLIGIRWTNLGRDTIPKALVTERKLQNDFITKCYCLNENRIDKNGWNLKYSLTSSDGLRISEVKFNGKQILTSAKLVDMHVIYSNTDGFGYSDAIGCPEFSESAVLAIEPPTISDLIIDNVSKGFVLEQKFYSQNWPKPCNYSYIQRYEFYNDGSFRVAGGSIGRGCGNDGMYRPVFRIAFANPKNSFYEMKDNNWIQWRKEKWQLCDYASSPKKFERFKITDTSSNGYFIAPDIGQLNEKNISDNAYIYVTLNQPGKEEGENDLNTIGPCCNVNYKQGPEKFIEPEADEISSKSLTVWYVPQLKNDDTPGKENCWATARLFNGTYKTTIYPCLGGPMFIPIKK